MSHRKKHARRDLAIVLIPAILIAAGALWAAQRFIKPAPPRRFVLAAGPSSGEYHAAASRYREILARAGIEVEVRTTAGSVENARLLSAPEGGVDAAFLQGGVRPPEAPPTDAESAASADEAPPAIVSLASVYFEPVWIYVAAGRPVERIADLRGSRIAIGGEGSGVAAIARLLLAEAGAAAAPTRLEPLAGEDANAALERGDVDAVFHVGSPRIRAVSRLASSPAARLLSIVEAEALRRRHRFLTPVVLPRGILDLERDVPAADVRLIAATANLVARSDFHPALVDMLLDASVRVHRQGGLFEEPGEFPAAERVDLPLSESARRFHESGLTFFYRWLPFGLANLFQRLLVLLVPLLTVILPLIKLVPAALAWRIRRRILRPYKQLLELESAAPAIGREEVLRRIDRIEDEVDHVSVPPAWAGSLYDLQLHIERVRRRHDATGSGAEKDAGGS